MAFNPKNANLSSIHPPTLSLTFFLSAFSLSLVLSTSLSLAVFVSGSISLSLSRSLFLDLAMSLSLTHGGRPMTLSHAGRSTDDSLALREVIR